MEPIICIHTSFRLSELLYLPLPSLPTTSQKTDSILIGANNPNHNGDDTDEALTSGGKWEDEEERRFFEDIQDLKDFVPKSVLGLEGEAEAEGDKDKDEEKEKIEKERVAEEVRKLEEELEGLKLNEGSNGHAVGSTAISETEDTKDDDDEYVTRDPVRISLLTRACPASQHPLLDLQGLRRHPCRPT
jgi:regulator of nonsense transcripts 2